MAATAVGFSASHVELIEGVRAPFWLPTAIAMAVAVPVLLAAGRRLDRLVLLGGEGAARRASELPAHARVQRLQRLVTVVSQRLELQPLAAADSIATLDAANRADVVRDPQVVKRRLQTEVERLRKSVDDLVPFAEQVEDFLAHSAQVRGLLDRMRSELTFMIDIRKYLWQRRLRARYRWLEEDLTDFFAVSVQTDEQKLQDLMAASASAAVAGPEPTATAGPQSPHRVLGVTEDMSTKAIKDVFRRLERIYHPDRGLVQDRAIFQEIQRAWSEIKRLRGVWS